MTFNPEPKREGMEGDFPAPAATAPHRCCHLHVSEQANRVSPPLELEPHVFLTTCQGSIEDLHCLCCLSVTPL